MNFENNMGALQPHNPKQKMVDFMGDKLMAVKLEDEKVFVGVKFICDGIGLSDGQMKNERRRIREDIVLSKGGRNLILPSNSGLQEYSCIELDFLPLWLAKISITPKMQEETPWVSDKLVAYQLKAKDVLAEAFLKKLPASPTEIAQLTLEAIVEQGERLSGVESQLIDLKQNQPLHPAQAAHVTKEVNRRIYGVIDEYFGGNKKAAKKLFGAINKDIHKAFRAPNRSMIPNGKYEDAVQFIKSWQPDSVIRHQLRFELADENRKEA